MRASVRCAVGLAMLAASTAACTGERSSPTGSESPQALRVFAAASLELPLEEIGRAYRASRVQAGAAPAAVELHFAGSGLLARQIELGAAADLFISAHPQWVDALSRAGLVRYGSHALASNGLALVAARGHTFTVRFDREFDLASEFEGCLATGEPQSVPLGAYAKSALQRLGWWPALERRLVGAVDARAALALVETGACTAGIVYTSEAAAARGVTVVAAVPKTLHEPIVYTAVVVRPEVNEELESYLDSLGGSRAQEIFASHGFFPAPHSG